MTGPACSYWLEQAEGDVPAGDQWLSAGERSHLRSLRFVKRRRDWRLGRWTAKRALASCLALKGDRHSLEDIEIRALPSGAPEVHLFCQRANVSISLSHRAGLGLCVVSLSGASLGCDLELLELREDSFVTDFFTADEQQLVKRAPAYEQPLLATLIWSAKESALKALKVGLRLPTASLEVGFTAGLPGPGEYTGHEDREFWSPLSVRCRGGRVLHGWWRCANDVMRTVVFNTLQAGWHSDRGSIWPRRISEAS
jgi:4'-phosphopantetheinyl transferase